MRDFLQNFSNFLQGDELKIVTAKNLSLRRNPNLASTFNKRLYLAQQCNKIKIQRSCYRSKQHLDSKKKEKRKITENKNHGLSHISAFL